MTNFNVIFNTSKGEITVYEGVDTIIIRQNDDKVEIPLKDWGAMYSAVKIANIKNRRRDL